ncbi:hypothetical protein [Micromonospora coxensis]|uniref:hypothetical protein n=1 Tax=Micromonospora coxensis TaxID=356852 RepID=UPI0012FD433B|nr:hypothetical protein [Micromonospora coxensis]
MDGRRETELLTAEDEAAEELARRVIGRVAPEETEIFAVVRDAYRRDPERLTGPGDGRDRMLGFGIEAAAALLTPLVLGISAEVVRHLALEAVGAIEVRDRLRRLLGRRRGDAPDALTATVDDALAIEPEAAPRAGAEQATAPRTAPPTGADDAEVAPADTAGPAAPAPRGADAAPPAPPVDVHRIRELVLTRCRQAGVEEDRAHLIADAVVGALHVDG